MRNKALQGLFTVLLCFMLYGCMLATFGEVTSDLSNLKFIGTNLDHMTIQIDCNNAFGANNWTDEQCYRYLHGEEVDIILKGREYGTETIPSGCSELYHLSF